MKCEKEGIKRRKESVELSVVCKVMDLQSCLSDLSDNTFLLPDLILNLHPDRLSDDFGTDLKPCADISPIRALKRATIYRQAEIERPLFQHLQHDHTGLAELECLHMTSLQSNEPQNKMGLKLVR